MTLVVDTTPQPPAAGAVGEARKPISWRWPAVTAIITALTAILALASSGSARFSMTGATGWFTIPEFSLPSPLTGLLMAAVALGITVLAFRRAIERQDVPGWLVGLAAAAFVITFLVWTVAGNAGAAIPVMRLLTGALAFAVPLAFGALSGVISERSGIINIAIEGQMIAGAFAGVVAASAAGSAWVGLISAPIAGIGIAALLAWFTITYRVNHIIVGVVLNMLALGLTAFLFTTVTTGTRWNQSLALPNLKIPLLSDIPVIGPVLFNQNILVYLAFGLIAFFQFYLFRSRWGLRTRAIGEHPKAADTVGIRVNALRWRNVLLGGALAGFGGAMFSIGMGLAFSKNMIAGNGYIALAAMILGGWRPLGAAMAALLFGFATNLGFVVQTVEAPMPTEFILMIPYIVTLLAVGGFIAAARPPAAEGEPYP